MVQLSRTSVRVTKQMVVHFIEHTDQCSMITLWPSSSSCSTSFPLPCFGTGSASAATSALRFADRPDTDTDTPGYIKTVVHWNTKIIIVARIEVTFLHKGIWKPMHHSTSQKMYILNSINKSIIFHSLQQLDNFSPPVQERVCVCDRDSRDNYNHNQDFNKDI